MDLGGGNVWCVVVLKFVLSQKKKKVGRETQVYVGSNREVLFGGCG